MGRKTVEKKPIRGKRLKTLCEELGVTQKELAEKIHLTPQTISKIVNGEANLTEENAKRVIAAFPGSSITFDLLMGYDQELMSFDSPLEYEKTWHKNGGAKHPVTNAIVAEARIAAALEKMNKKGWILAVNMVETLSDMQDLQADKGGKK